MPGREAANFLAPEARRGASGALQALFYLAYPLVIYLAYSRLGTRGLGALLLVFYGLSLLLRARASRADAWPLVRRGAGLGLLIALAVVSGNHTLLLLLPVIVSLYLLWVFAASLRNGPPMVERFARLVEEDLPDFTVPYCRKVTAVWCGFLAVNALLVSGLALAAPLEWWALYTGLIFYVLMGTLVAGEFVVRKLWFRYYQDGLADRLFARAFPPERTANGRRSLAYQAARLQRRAEVSRASA
ncbi:MAG TPA: hypothetical protein VIY27_05460 [Myxococcota bacterium]